MHSTCFWGGDAFAPQLKVKTKDGEELPVQQFLQDAYLNMWEVVLKTLTDLDCVAGFDVGSSSSSDTRRFSPSSSWHDQMMNEPHRGYIDLPSLHKFAYMSDLHLSHVRACFKIDFATYHTHPCF